MFLQQLATSFDMADHQWANVFIIYITSGHVTEFLYSLLLRPRSARKKSLSKQVLTAFLLYFVPLSFDDNLPRRNTMRAFVKTDTASTIK